MYEHCTGFAVAIILHIGWCITIIDSPFIRTVRKACRIPLRELSCFCSNTGQDTQLECIVCMRRFCVSLPAPSHYPTLNLDLLTQNTRPPTYRILFSIVVIIEKYAWQCKHIYASIWRACQMYPCRHIWIHSNTYDISQRRFKLQIDRRSEKEQTNISTSYIGLVMWPCRWRKHLRTKINLEPTLIQNVWSACAHITLRSHRCGNGGRESVVQLHHVDLTTADKGGWDGCAWQWVGKVTSHVQLDTESTLTCRHYPSFQTTCPLLCPKTADVCAKQRCHTSVPTRRAWCAYACARGSHRSRSSACNSSRSIVPEPEDSFAMRTDVVGGRWGVYAGENRTIFVVHSHEASDIVHV